MLMLCLMLGVALAAGPTDTPVTNDIVNDVNPTAAGRMPSGSFTTQDDPPDTAWTKTVTMTYTVGVSPVQDTLMWVSAGQTELRIYVYNIADPARPLVDSFPETGGPSGWGIRDMAWKASTNEVFAGYDNQSFHVYDATTHIPNNTYTVSGYSGTVRGFAYDPAQDSCWTCNFTTSPMAKFSITGANGHQVKAAADMLSSYGIAWSPLQNCFWVGQAGAAGASPIYKMDASYAWVDSFNPVGWDLAGGCEMWRDTFLLVVEQGTPDIVWCFKFQMGPPPGDDVGMYQILAPSSIVTPGSIQPKARIKNYGTDPESNIPVTCWIDSGATRVYTASANYVGPLAAGATADVPFSPNWPAVGGTYNVTMFTSLGGDMTPGNDTMRGTSQVMSYTIDWTQPTNIPTEGVSRTAACTGPDGKVHVICGNCQTHTSHPNDEIYDPVANSWSTGLAHPQGNSAGVHNHEAVAINDVIWCGGGSNPTSFYNNLTKLDLGGGTWTSAAAMPVNDLIYYVMEAYPDSGWVYVLGGSPDGTGGPLDSCWRYKTTTGTWDRMANMPAVRRNMMTACLGDTIYVIGGMSGNDYTSTHGTVWKYSVLGNTWTPAADTMPDNLGWGRAVAYTSAYGQSIYVFGGYRAGTIVNACWRYDVSGGGWYADHTMMTATRSQGGDIYGNKVWSVGGFGASILANVQKGTIAEVGIEEGSKVQVGPSSKAFPTLVRDLVRISYSLGKAARVNLGIYDASGALVRTLVDGAVGPGSRTATWNRTDESGRRVASGTYFYRLSVDGKSVSGKTVVLQ